MLIVVIDDPYDRFRYNRQAYEMPVGGGIHRISSRDEARRDLFAYIEGYYNRQCIHSALNYLTPEQAERTGK